MKICKLKGCDGKHYARGFCRKHYMQIPEIKEKALATARAWSKRNRLRLRASFLSKKYGIKLTLFAHGITSDGISLSNFKVLVKGKITPGSVIVVYISSFGVNTLPRISRKSTLKYKVQIIDFIKRREFWSGEVYEVPGRIRKLFKGTRFPTRMRLMR